MTNGIHVAISAARQWRSGGSQRKWRKPVANVYQCDGNDEILVMMMAKRNGLTWLWRLMSWRQCGSCVATAYVALKRNRHVWRK